MNLLIILLAKYVNSHFIIGKEFCFYYTSSYCQRYEIWIEQRISNLIYIEQLGEYEPYHPLQAPPPLLRTVDGSRGGKGNQGVCFLIYSCPRDEEDERTRSEAAGVLAQLTSPWIEGGLNPASVEEHAYDMVSSLTQLSGSTRYRVYQKTIEH